MNAVLMGGPRLTGGSHGLEREARLVTQMSMSPSPPSRSEAKYIVSSSAVTVALLSFAAELTTGPRLTGADHVASVDGRKRGSTANRSASVGGSTPHARSKAAARDASRWVRAVRIVTSYGGFCPNENADIGDGHAAGSSLT